MAGQVLLPAARRGELGRRRPAGPAVPAQPVAGPRTLGPRLGVHAPGGDPGLSGRARGSDRASDPRHRRIRAAGQLLHDAVPVRRGGGVAPRGVRRHRSRRGPGPDHAGATGSGPSDRPSAGAVMSTDPVEVDEQLLRGWPLDGLADGEVGGSLLIVGGSRVTPGAVLLSAVAALRAGAGKVQVLTARSAAATLAVA